MKKTIVDILLFGLMLIQFSKEYLAPIIHEIIGILLLILVIIHLILNRKYLKTIAMGKYDFKRSLMLFVNLSFLISFVISITLGVLSSQYVFTFMNIGNMTTIYLHKIFEYISLIMMGIHLGINLNKQFEKIEEKIGKISYILYLIITILGIYSAIKLDFWNHIIGNSGFSVGTNTFLANSLEYLFLTMMITIITSLIWRKNMIL